jgi:hypothetical protein
MAAAGLTLGSAGPAQGATPARPAAHDPRGLAQRGPVQRSGLDRGNQRITFVRSAGLNGETIRATADGPVGGFGTVRVVSFEPDAVTGRFRGVWELAFRRGTIRYAFAGAARDLTAADTGPLALTSAETTVPATLADGRALVAGTFQLGAGTGAFAGVTGSGTFRGWTVPQDDLPLPQLEGTTEDVD